VIYGDRVKQARLFLNETQAQFSTQIGLTQSQLSGLENTAKEIAPDTLLALAEHTGFRPEFFMRPPAAPVDEYQFRARLRYKAGDRNQAVRAAQLVHESYELMRQQVTAPDVRLTGPTLGADPRETARAARQVLGLDSAAPIPNLIGAVERAGVTVLALPVVGKKHDAFSWWHEGESRYPVIITLAGAPGDRLRWNIAHELGHILLHPAGGSPEFEKEADQFAAELLTPLHSLANEMPTSPKLSALYAMKLRWGVSVQSLIRRAKDLGLVTDDQYMSLFKQISARGERMNERNQIRKEKPRVYRKMAEVIFGPSPASGLADLALWTPEFAEDVLDQFAVAGETPPRRVFSTKPADNVVPLRSRR
jgi:Zn-dependent peptidase ImmA (M78 family)/transcriptional regulator with XRE-family HTH domain